MPTELEMLNELYEICGASSIARRFKTNPVKVSNWKSGRLPIQPKDGDAIRQLWLEYEGRPRSAHFVLLDMIAKYGVHDVANKLNTDCGDIALWASGKRTIPPIGKAALYLWWEIGNKVGIKQIAVWRQYGIA